MKKKELVVNTISSFSLQVVTIVCGLILPRLILQVYGSGINGLVNSIGQFLHVISFLELGIGAVVQSTLYKPLSDNDYNEVSCILASAEKFFRKIGLILLVYVLILMSVYPFLTHQEDNRFYIAILIAVISISSFAQYYFGVVDGLLLNADQRGYVQYTAAIVSLVLTTVICCIEINMGLSIHIVKLSSSLLYLIRPIVLRWYVNRHYNINRRIKYDKEPIHQKWNGIAQHISAVVLDGTDIIVLTLFSTLANVSIYSVYNLVTYGIKNLFLAVANGGAQSFLGNMWAKGEKENLQTTFSWMEWLIHNVATFLFTCTGILIVPFVTVYTHGVTDADYIQPLFAVLIVVANGVHCLRLPYHIMIKAAGKYKETQSCYFISTAMNVVISVVTVKIWGLIGVTIGTLISMLYQTLWMAWFNFAKLVKEEKYGFAKQCVVDLLCCVLCIVSCSFFAMQEISYFSWLKLAVIDAFISLAVMIIVNSFFYRAKIVRLFGFVKQAFFKEKK